MTDFMSFIVLSALTILVIVFQFCLAIGLPWGAASMGGKYPGVYPKEKRLIPVMSIVLLAVIMLVTFVRMGLLLDGFFEVSKIFMWVVVAFFGIGTILNTITPSKIERIWAPVAFLQLICSISIAI